MIFPGGIYSPQSFPNFQSPQNLRIKTEICFPSVNIPQLSPSVRASNTNFLLLNRTHTHTNVHPNDDDGFRKKGFDPFSLQANITSWWLFGKVKWSDGFACGKGQLFFCFFQEDNPRLHALFDMQNGMCLIFTTRNSICILGCWTFLGDVRK